MSNKKRLVNLLHKYKIEAIVFFIGITVFSIVSLTISTPIFDEFFYILFIQNYTQRIFYFDIHPAFGRLIMLVFDSIFNSHNNLQSVISSSNFDLVAMLQYNTFAIRLPSIILSSSSLVLVYKTLRSLTKNFRLSILIVLLYLLDNANTIHSSLALLEPYQIFLNLLLLYYLLKNFHQKPSTKQILFFGIILGLSLSTKVNSIFFVIPLIFWIIKAKSIKVIIKESFTLFSTTLLLFTLINTIHLKLAPHPSKILNPISGLVEYIKFGKRHTKSISKASVNPSVQPSEPYQWILGYKPLKYFDKDFFYQHLPTSSHSLLQNTKEYLFLPNIVVWVSGFLGVVFFIGIAFHQRKKFFKDSNNLFILSLVTTYFVYLISTSFVDRQFYSYHYLIVLPISLIILGYTQSLIKNKVFLKLALALALIYSILFTPIAFGISLPKNYQNFLHFIHPFI